MSYLTGISIASQRNMISFDQPFLSDIPLVDWLGRLAAFDAPEKDTPLSVPHIIVFLGHVEKY